MDGCSGKRGVDGPVVPRKGLGVVPRENMNNRDKSLPVCSRIGCSARINSTKGTKVGSAGKAKSSRTLFCPSSNGNGKEIVGSSSRTLNGAGNSRKTFKGTSQLETGLSEAISVLDEPETSRKTKRHSSIHSENIDAGRSSMASRRGTHKSPHARFDSRTQDGLVDPSVSLSSGSSSSSSQATTHGNLGRHGPRNLKCDSISNVVPSGYSSSNSISSSTRKKEVFRKRNSDGESSSSDRGKKMTRPLVEGRSQNSIHGVSTSGSRRNRNSPSNSRETSVVSVSTRRPTGYYGRTRHFGTGVSSATVLQTTQPIMLNDPDPSLLAESTFSSSNSNSYSSPSEVGAPRSLMSRDSFRRYNLDGIAEILLALERIEHDEELTYEQLLVLETNLFLSGLSLHDQHRDMRLDIDNMTYEELLALEERMGTVSTALSEESLSKSLKTSIYQWTSLADETGNSCQDKDDVQCSICQEEYVDGEEVGKLHCEHRYHVDCIQQWLRMKNWCPICKTCAEPSPPSLLQSLS